MPEDAVVAPTARRQQLRRGQAAAVLLATGALLGLAACAATGQTVTADVQTVGRISPGAEALA